MTPYASNVTEKRFAQRLSTMIDARLICYKHYFIWADELIAALPEPPQWLLEIAIIRYYPDAVAAINRFVQSDPCASSDNIDNEHIACTFHRHRIGAISWASFLEAAGRYSDGAGDCRVDCEFFFDMLNDLTDANYGRDREKNQVQCVQSEFASEIESVGEMYSVFHDFFQRFVAVNSEE